MKSWALSFTSAVVDKCFCWQNWRQTSNFEKMRHADKDCFGNIIMYCFVKEKIHKKKIKKKRVKLSLQKGLTVCERLHCQASAAACLTLSPPLFTQPVPMIHRVTRSLDFGRNILHFFPDHCFVGNCRCRDEIWPDMSTKKSFTHIDRMQHGSQEVLVGDSFQDDLDVSLQDAGLGEELGLVSERLRYLYLSLPFPLEHRALDMVKHWSFWYHFISNYWTAQLDTEKTLKGHTFLLIHLHTCQPWHLRNRDKWEENLKK